MDSFSLQVQSVTPAPGGATQTAIMDYSSCITEAELTTNRFDSPAKLSFTVIGQNSITIPEGSSVELAVDGVKMFKGYIFTAEQNRDGEVAYTAYDQLRYLKANASYVFEAMTLPQIIQQIAADFDLTCGTLADTGYAFPCLIKENESCLDIIFDALIETIYMTGKIFNFYDDNGALTLTEARDMFSNTLIGDKSLATDFSYKRDIDSDTYNRVKLVRPNKETGMADTYIAEDTETRSKWGLLQYYDQVDENMNAAQIEQMCMQYLQYYNRVVQELSVDALGVVGIRAGMIIPMRISAVDSLSVSRLMLAEKVTHSFKGGEHTMSIDVKDFQNLGGDLSIV